MKLGLRDARAIAELLDGHTLRLSAFSNSFITLLKQDGMVIITRINTRSSEVRAKDPEVLSRFLEQKFTVANIRIYIAVLEADNPTRADLARDNIGTKQRSIHPKSGMHLSSPNAAVVIVNGTKVTLSFPPYCALFIHKSADVHLTEDTVIVGVENFENITFATHQLSISDQSYPLIFVERGPVMRSWVTSLNNQYIHYGDIDLAGIGIYLNEYEPYIKAPSSFWLPFDIEERIAHNKNPDSRKNYEKQLSQYKYVRAENPRLQNIIRLIHEHKGGIEQEIFITNVNDAHDVNILH